MISSYTILNLAHFFENDYINNFFVARIDTVQKMYLDFLLRKYATAQGWLLTDRLKSGFCKC